MSLEVKIALKNLMALFLFLILSFCISCYEVDARSSFTRSQDLKSIPLTVDNDFDCIDIYKQPAFEHPLLKNHKIQLNPTFARDTMQSRLPNIGNFTKGCPPGKVPIHRRKIRHQMSTNSSSELQIEDFHQYSRSYPGHHFATLDTTKSTTYRGASAIFSFGVRNLPLHANQYSISQIWLQTAGPAELNSIQVGWGVHPSLYGDNRLHLTTRWTTDNYRNTGCFNHLCPGFVQVDRSHYLGGPVGLEQVVKKIYIGATVNQDQSTGNWWLTVGTIHIGYWAKEIFTHLGGGASLIRYGGETFSPPNMISPPMGSGELPKKSPESHFMGSLQIVDSGYKENNVNPNDMKSYRDTSSNCYDLLYYKQDLFFGGPGGQCGI